MSIKWKNLLLLNLCIKILPISQLHLISATQHSSIVYSRVTEKSNMCWRFLLLSTHLKKESMSTMRIFFLIWYNSLKLHHSLRHWGRKKERSKERKKWVEKKRKEMERQGKTSWVETYPSRWFLSGNKCLPVSRILPVPLWLMPCLTAT